MKLFYFAGKEELDNFVKSAADCRGAEFLQSWQWGELLRAEKVEILRVGISAEIHGKEVIVAAATLIKNALPGGYSYWYAPRGPIFQKGILEKERNEVEDFLYFEIKKLDTRAIFLRVEPAEIIASRSFVFKKTVDLQPKQTLLLDLSLSAAEILKGMHQKTRYNINLALKKGVEIRQGSSADFEEFWRLMSLTGTRDSFRLHRADHYRNLLTAPQIKLFFASLDGQNIAAGLFCFWGDKATYMHGASDNKFRNAMSPYLLQWILIQKAQAEGYKYYDFYGTDEKKWPGVTRFKLGFGGRIENYPGTYDVIFRSFLYGIYFIVLVVTHSILYDRVVPL
jgi:lipid II:glycine glycyltransferase (peptidoglycan interpeptide bridge formation enzyme)